MSKDVDFAELWYVPIEAMRQRKTKAYTVEHLAYARSKVENRYGEERAYNLKEAAKIAREFLENPRILNEEEKAEAIVWQERRNKSQWAPAQFLEQGPELLAHWAESGLRILAGDSYIGKHLAKRDESGETMIKMTAVNAVLWMSCGDGWNILELARMCGVAGTREVANNSLDYPHKGQETNRRIGLWWEKLARPGLEKWLDGVIDKGLLKKMVASKDKNIRMMALKRMNDVAQGSGGGKRQGKKARKV